MKDNFDLKKFLVENKMTVVSQLREEEDTEDSGKIIHACSGSEAEELFNTLPHPLRGVTVDPFSPSPHLNSAADLEKYFQAVEHKFGCSTFTVENEDSYNNVLSPYNCPEYDRKKEMQDKDLSDYYSSKNTSHFTGD